MHYTWDKLNIAQYQRLLTLGDKAKPEDLIWALTGKNKNEIPIKDLKSLSVGKLEPKGDPAQLRLVHHNGIVYGMQDMSTLSFGLFADIMELGKDLNKHLPDMVSYMYRPVTKISFWSTVKLRIIGQIGTKLKTKWGIALMYKWLTNMKYEIEEYDPAKCDARIKDIKEMPASIGHNVATFFLILSRQLQIDGLKSLRDQAKTMKEILATIGKEGLLEQISPAGDGTQSSGDSQENKLSILKRLSSWITRSSSQQ